ncbi:VanZ family protein [Paraliobacillus sp. JSM ZJ581]
MKKVKVIFSISFIFYLLVMLMLMFLDNRGYMWTNLSMFEYIRYSSNLIPFRTISTYIQAIFDGSMNIDVPIKNLSGNLFMFLPMGIYLPFFIRKLHKANLFLISMIVILFVLEVVQLITRRGSFDIDDFILNLIGALMGFGIWKSKVAQKLLR